MAHFALIWKARTIEKYRRNYENEKINSIIMSNADIPDKTLFQRWRHYSHNLQTRLSRTFSKWYPEGSVVSNFYVAFRSDNMRLPTILLRGLYGFIGGLLLAYLGFMFFVFQLSLSLMHATVLSSVLGVILTLGLTFSTRMRCLIFLLIPQLFSRVGRYTLTCYALVLILTGPATNTLKNSEILTESMACSQEQLKTNVKETNELMKKTFNAIKDSLKITIYNMKLAVARLKTALIRIHRLILSIASVTQSGYSWLESVVKTCNRILGQPQDRCLEALRARCDQNYSKTYMKHPVQTTTNAYKEHKDTKEPNRRRHSFLRQILTRSSNVDYVVQQVCSSMKYYDKYCVAADFVEEAFLATIKRKLKTFTHRLSRLLYVKLNIHHTYIFIGNTSTSQISSGIVTEIRNRADPILTWLSWSSCVTSLFLLLIIFRAKHYQHMFETRSRFDNRFITKEFRALDLKRLREGRDTVLPLNRRERAKYVTTTSFRLVASEKVHLNRSAIFMTVTTFKLMIHIVADYSLYWVLTIIRHHGKMLTPLQLPSESGAFISGSGFVSRLLQSFVDSINTLLSLPPPDKSCLPNPRPPDIKRYCQIGFLICLLWFFALFEPYGLRLRHIIMGHHRPERASTRAVWLYNHILRTRASFMKFARRKLHRQYKYSSHSHLTVTHWLQAAIPFTCLKALLGIKREKHRCVLCYISQATNNADSTLIMCQTPRCPGLYCKSCFSDMGELCTICMAPSDYGDLSDASLESGSSDDSSDGNDDDDGNNLANRHNIANKNNNFDDITTSRSSNFANIKGLQKKGESGRENLPLLHKHNAMYSNKSGKSFRINCYKLLEVINEEQYISKQLDLSRIILQANYNNFDGFKDENNNDVVFQRFPIHVIQYNAYNMIKATKLMIVKTIENITPLAKYLRKKGIIRRRKNENNKSRRKRQIMIKHLNRKRIRRKGLILHEDKAKQGNYVTYFITCSSREITSQEKKGKNAGTKDKHKKSVKDENKLKEDCDETKIKRHKKGRSTIACPWIKKMTTTLAKYWSNTTATESPSERRKNKIMTTKNKNNSKKKKRKKSNKRNSSNLHRNSRILSYFDSWDWMQHHVIYKFNKHKISRAARKNFNIENDCPEEQIYNNVKIPPLNLKSLSASSIEAEFLDSTSGLEDLSSNSKVKPKRIKRLSTPVSLIKNVYSSILLRFNISSETATVVPTCSCACQYDISKVKMVSTSTQAAFEEKKPVLVDAQVSAVQSTCACATQHHVTTNNIGTATSETNRDCECLRKSLTSKHLNTLQTCSTQTDKIKTITLNPRNEQYCAKCMQKYALLKRTEKEKEKLFENYINAEKSHLEKAKHNVKTRTYNDWWSPIFEPNELNEHKSKDGGRKTPARNKKWKVVKTSPRERIDIFKGKVQIVSNTAESRKCHNWKSGQG